MDAMEADLDGVQMQPQAEFNQIRAARKANQEPELIMLALRGLPLFPDAVVASGSPPEAAFIVGGGPPCLMREVLLPPFAHDSAPLQLYASIERARTLQNSSEFKAAVAELELVLRVWRTKHLWKMLRDHPAMTLQQSLVEDVKRAEERRLRAIWREEERLRIEAEEAEFARKMAETGGTDSEGAAPVASADGAAAAAAAQHSDSEGSGDDEESEDDSSETDEAAAGAPAAGGDAGAGATKHGHHGHHHHHHHGKHHHHLGSADDDVLEFPAVSAEEELEFLVYFYNALGGIYQSASAASVSGGVPRAPASSSASGGDGSAGAGGGVRWGRTRVVPRAMDHPTMVAMIAGTKPGAQLDRASSDAATAADAAAAAAADGDENDDDISSSTEFCEDDYVASSGLDLSNNSARRALVALWQAKRAHDLYVGLKDAEKSRLAQQARDAEAAARGASSSSSKQQGDDDDLSDERSSFGMTDNGSDKPEGAGAPEGLTTTLGVPAFNRINIPNLTLETLLGESKALGLFGFPPGLVTASASSSSSSVAAKSSSSSSSSLQAQERANNFVFWSSQPILASLRQHRGGGGGGANNHADSNKSLSSFRSAPAAPASSIGPAATATNGGVPQKLINPYVYCSAADALSYSNLGACLYHLGNYALSLRCFHVSLQIRCATLRPDDAEYVDVGVSLNNLGGVLAALGSFPLAWDYFTAARELLTLRLDPTHPRLNTLNNNIAKIASRRQALPSAIAGPALLKQLRNIAENKERKEYEIQEKRNAKLAAGGGGGGGGKKGSGAATPGGARPGTSASASAAATGRKPAAAPPGKGAKGAVEEPPKEFHQDPRFFQEAKAGQPPIVPVRAEGAPLPPLGSAAAAIQTMPLRQWDVQMGEMQALMMEFGPAKKAGKAAGGKKGKSKKK